MFSLGTGLGQIRSGQVRSAQHAEKGGKRKRGRRRLVVLPGWKGRARKVRVRGVGRLFGDKEGKEQRVFPLFPLFQECRANAATGRNQWANNKRQLEADAGFALIRVALGRRNLRAALTDQYSL